LSQPLHERLRIGQKRWETGEETKGPGYSTIVEGLELCVTGDERGTRSPLRIGRRLLKGMTPKNKRKYSLAQSSMQGDRDEIEQLFWQVDVICQRKLTKRDEKKASKERNCFAEPRVLERNTYAADKSENRKRWGRKRDLGEEKENAPG